LAGADDRLGAEVAKLRNELAESATLSAEATERFENRLAKVEVAQRISAASRYSVS